MPRSRVLAMDVLRGGRPAEAFPRHCSRVGTRCARPWPTCCQALPGRSSGSGRGPRVGAPATPRQQLAASLGGADGVCAGIDFTTLVAVRRSWIQRFWASTCTGPWRTRGLALALVEARPTAATSLGSTRWPAPAGDSSTRPGRQWLPPAASPSCSDATAPVPRHDRRLDRRCWRRAARRATG